MRKNFFKKRKGISIVLAVLILTTLLAIALGISTFISREIKMIREVGYSTQAFYAADSGIEEALLTSTFPSGQVDGANYAVSCTCCNSNLYGNVCPTPVCPNLCPVGSGCLAPNYCLNSIGTYQNFSRAIQIIY